MRFVVAAIILLTIEPAMAQEAPLHRFRSIPSSQLLTAVAMNGSAGTRTFTFVNPAGGYAQANLAMARTRVAATDLSMTCTRTNTAGVAATMMTCAFGTGDGICTHVPVTWLRTSSTTDTPEFQVNMLGYVSATCVVASTSAGGSDLLTITGGLVTQ